MAINTTAAKRGWRYDYANSRLSAYVDGVESIQLRPSATGAMGTYDAGLKLVYVNTAALTSGRICGISINVEPIATVDSLKVVGGEVCTYMGASVSVSTTVHGLFVETQGAGTVTSDWYSLYVYNAPSCTPGGSKAAVRIEQNATTDARSGNFIDFVGGKSNFLFSCDPLAAQTAWSTTGTPGAVTGATGWLKIQVGSATRYIALTDSVS